MVYTPPPELAELSLAQIAEQVEARKLPPIESWNPERTGDSEMRIAADGTWYHDGGKVKRPAMVRAFASLLMRDEDGDHWLVMPFQKLSIVVEDAALVAVDAMRRNDGIGFRLNTDELVVAGPDNRLIARGDADTPALYLEVRRGLEARLNRSTYQQLADIALADGEDWTVTSQGAQFSLLPE